MEIVLLLMCIILIVKKKLIKYTIVLFQLCVVIGIIINTTENNWYLYVIWTALAGGLFILFILIVTLINKNAAETIKVLNYPQLILIIGFLFIYGTIMYFIIIKYNSYNLFNLIELKRIRPYILLSNSALFLIFYFAAYVGLLLWYLNYNLIYISAAGRSY